MPLVLDPSEYPESVLVELVRSLRQDLLEVEELAARPHGAVIDAASLSTARELAQAALALTGREGPRSRAELAAEANLAYATILSVIDLVKSHTDVPRVPRSRKTST